MVDHKSWKVKFEKIRALQEYKAYLAENLYFLENESEDINPYPEGKINHIREQIRNVNSQLRELGVDV